MIEGGQRLGALVLMDTDALGLKALAYASVTIPPWPPKPDLMPLTGGYRRTPVMQIGADIYCDTLLIPRRIERLQPSPLLFPNGSEHLATLLGLGIEKSIFVAAVGVIVGLTGQNYPRALVEDRFHFFGFSLEHADMLARQAQFVNRLNAHPCWLVGLTAHEIVLYRRDRRLGDLHIHFPRAGFDVEGAPLQN